MLVAQLLTLLAASAAVGAAGSGPDIQHVVVLVMENRAFDHMIGVLAETYPAINGCPPSNPSPACSNPIDPSNATSPRVHTDNTAVFIQPADPDHGITSTAQQMWGDQTPSPDAVPPMDGFIINYSKFYNGTGGGPFIMKCFDPSHVPVITTLAQEYAVFNNWHAGIPGSTMINRAYIDSATSDGMGNNDVEDILLGYPQRTIYEDLDLSNATWKVYFELIPTSWQFKYTRKHLGNYNIYDQFAIDAANGDLASYTFIDPQYNEFLGRPARDQHPDHDVAEGEKLMKEVYEAVRSSPKWNNTLLLITYDEHGGFFDHVPPPVAPNPDGKNSTNPPFDFKRLGIRVPAIAISPYTAKGTVVNNPTPVAPGVGMYYEHSSIPKSLHALFAPQAPPLTAREVFAAPFHTAVLNLEEPRSDCPMTLPTPTSHREMSRLGPIDGHRPMSGLQVELAVMAAGVAGDSVDVLDGLVSEHHGAQYMASVVNKVFGRQAIVVPDAPEGRVGVSVADMGAALAQE